MTVTTPSGFRASGIPAGIKGEGRLDLALVVNDGPKQAAAAVFTSNRATANPIRWSKKALAASGGNAKAIVLNSGGANCFTGPYGFETTVLTAQETAALLSADVDEVQVCSTGLIGFGGEGFRNAILRSLPRLVETASQAGGEAAAKAIMTTDTRPKTAQYTSPDGWSIGGMAKGAGMLAPGLATMLVVLTTDVSLTSSQADNALREAVETTFNRLDSDGCMSTNDQVTLMASGASDATPSQEAFAEHLRDVCLDLAMQLQSDAEGSTHDIAIQVVGAPSVPDAVAIGRSVSRSNLFKAAVFGNDPNWGRILAAIGTTDTDFDPDQVDVSINGVRVCSGGGPDRPVEDVDMTPRQVDITINLFAGSSEATVWTNDLTHGYVTENSAYSS